jgi:predicted nuclease of predicted toxin-antitoxin system
MSLLFDQNLSRRLVGLLVAEYPGSEHVQSAGLLGAGDLTVWRYAAALGYGRPDELSCRFYR